jgi:hypothetical protein
METWQYAALCIVVPGIWSIVLHLVFRAIEKRRRRPKKQGPAVDYFI